MLNMEPGRTLVGFLIRHGELKNMNIWDGWGEYSLSEKGRQSAEKAAQWLSFEKIGRVIASDVPRTIETGQCIMDACDVSCPFMYCEPNIRPWNVGDEFTGKEKTDARKEAFKYYVDHPDVVIPGGESRDQLRLRVQIIATYLASPYNALPSVIVTHNSVIKVIMGADELKDGVEPGGIVGVFMNTKGEFEFEALLGATDTEES